MKVTQWSKAVRTRKLSRKPAFAESEPVKFQTGKGGWDKKSQGS
jgi:hypothetical protein